MLYPGFPGLICIILFSGNKIVTFLTGMCAMSGAYAFAVPFHRREPSPLRATKKAPVRVPFRSVRRDVDGMAVPETS